VPVVDGDATYHYASPCLIQLQILFEQPHVLRRGLVDVDVDVGAKMEGEQGERAYVAAEIDDGCPRPKPFQERSRILPAEADRDHLVDVGRVRAVAEPQTVPQVQRPLARTQPSKLI